MTFSSTRWDHWIVCGFPVQHRISEIPSMQKTGARIEFICFSSLSPESPIVRCLKTAVYWSLLLITTSVVLSHLNLWQCIVLMYLEIFYCVLTFCYTSSLGIMRVSTENIFLHVGFVPSWEQRGTSDWGPRLISALPTCSGSLWCCQ